MKITELETKLKVYIDTVKELIASGAEHREIAQAFKNASDNVPKPWFEQPEMKLILAESIRYSESIGDIKGAMKMYDDFNSIRTPKYKDPDLEFVVVKMYEDLGDPGYAKKKLCAIYLNFGASVFEGRDQYAETLKYCQKQWG